MISCPRCSQVLPDNATFCMSCGTPMQGGYRAPQPSAGSAVRPGYSADGLRICHACGAIAPTERSTCSICTHPYTRLEERAPERPDGAYWAQMRTELTCRQCGSKSPVDEPDVEGTVTCLACNTVQAFEVSVWSDAFAHAHAVADLAGPNVEGRSGGSGSIAGRNPFLPIGISNTTSTLELTGMTISGGVMRTRNLSVSASPGHPLCGVCHTPIEAHVEGGNRISTRCPTCGDRAAYTMPSTLSSLHAPLVLTLADDQRVDRPEARVNATSAGMVVALHCPSCGGAIDVQVGERAATCPFCKTACRIPQRTLLSLKKQNERPRPWWALFRGPSPKRQELERDASSDSEPANPYASRNTEKARLEDAPEDMSPRGKLVDRVISIAVPLAVFFVVSVICFMPVVWGWLNGYGSGTEPPPLPIPWP